MNLSDGGNISGATTANLTINPLSPADAADWNEAELPDRGRVARAGDVDGAEALERRTAGLPIAERQQRVHRPPGAVLLESTRVGGDRVLRGGEQRRVAGDRVGSEEDVVRLLRRPAEDAPEPVDEDDDAAVGDRERIAPQAERMGEAQVGREQRIRLFPRQERSGAGNPDDERVERFLESRPPQLDRTEKGLGVRHRRRPREHGGQGSRSTERAKHAQAHGFRRSAEREPQR